MAGSTGTIASLVSLLSLVIFFPSALQRFKQQVYALVQRPTNWYQHNIGTGASSAIADASKSFQSKRAYVDSQNSTLNEKKKPIQAFYLVSSECGDDELSVWYLKWIYDNCPSILIGPKSTANMCVCHVMQDFWLRWWRSKHYFAQWWLAHACHTDVKI